MSRASWCLCKFNEDQSYYAYCSKCKNTIKASIMVDGLVEIPYFDKLLNTCPVCGRDMIIPVNNYSFELFDKVGDQIERCK